MTFYLSSFYAKLIVHDKDTDLFFLLVLARATFEERERFIIEPQYRFFGT